MGCCTSQPKDTTQVGFDNLDKKGGKDATDKKCKNSWSPWRKREITALCKTFQEKVTSCCCYTKDNLDEKGGKDATDKKRKNSYTKDPPNLPTAQEKANEEGTSGGSSHRRIKALYDYTARTEDDFSFMKNDILLWLDQGDDENEDWWYAKHTDPKYTNQKQEGYVPRNYVALEDTLDTQEWFFGKISRKETERNLLTPSNEAGVFLIRQGETRPHGSFVLSVKDRDQVKGDCVKHYKVRIMDSGEVYIAARQYFNNIIELVEHYKHEADGLCRSLKTPCPRAAPIMTDLCRDMKDACEIPRESLHMTKKLGVGQFGDVWKGTWNRTTDVAIKTLKPGTVSKTAFLNEATIMKKCRHEKLVRLYAVCSLEEPIYIVTELLRDSLLNYLRVGDGRYIKFPEMVDMAGQIASGMEYLESNKLIHRDLAARNILVGENSTVKVADFGLATLIDQYDQYNPKNVYKSMKWMAPEAMLYGRFTIKSDVWSYGVLLFEITTHGQVPYPGMTGRPWQELVERGYRMAKPPTIPDTMYEIMLKCWDKKSEERPTFEFLCGFFDDYFIAADL